MPRMRSNEHANAHTHAHAQRFRPATHRNTVLFLALCSILTPQRRCYVFLRHRRAVSGLLLHLLDGQCGRPRLVRLPRSNRAAACSRGRAVLGAGSVVMAVSGPCQTGGGLSPRLRQKGFPYGDGVGRATGHRTKAVHLAAEAAIATPGVCRAAPACVVQPGGN